MERILLICTILNIRYLGGNMDLFGDMIGATGGLLDPLDLFGTRSSKAAGEMAKAQQQAALPSSAEIQALQDQINLYQRTLQLSEANIARQERTLNAIDPNLVESGKQLFNMMTGKDSQYLDPLKRQRAEQKAQLESRLKEQMGSGYAGSSAGQLALGGFDQQTSDAIIAGQERGLSTFGQLFGNLQGMQNNAFSSQMAGGAQVGGVLGSILSSQNQIKSRGIPGAGADYTEAYMRAKQQQALGGDIVKLGAMAMTGGGSVPATGLPGQSMSQSPQVYNPYSQWNLGVDKQMYYGN